jgi:translation initiation factor 6
LAIFLFNIFGNASIGVYCLVTNEMAIVPPQATDAIAEKLEEWLKVRVVRSTIGGSTVIGALACANSNGIVLPHATNEDEIAAIKSVSGINIGVMQTKKNAYGNLVLANDCGAIVDIQLKKEDVAKIEDTLDVEAVSGEIAGLPYVGSVATATSKGVLAHPLLKDEEQRVLADVLKVNVDVGTINCGIPYVSTGLLGNRHGAVAGSATTGPELFMIGQALDVVK